MIEEIKQLIENGAQEIVTRDLMAEELKQKEKQAAVLHEEIEQLKERIGPGWIEPKWSLELHRIIKNEIERQHEQRKN